MMTKKASWFHFLHERHLLILEWVADGKSYAEIAHTLSMDPVQVELISMTPENAMPPLPPRDE